MPTEDIFKRLTGPIHLPQYLRLCNRKRRLKLQLADRRVVRERRKESKGDAIAVANDDLIYHSAKYLTSSSIDCDLIHGISFQKSAK